MKKIAMLALAVGMMVPAVSRAEMWGGPLQHVGAWAKNKVMLKGWMAAEVKKVEKHHPAYAKELGKALQALNDHFGKLKGCFPNFRLALANITAPAANGAKIALAGPMGPSLVAFVAGLDKVGEGGKAGAIKALRAALPELKKAKPAFKNGVRTAIRWLEKPCNL